jgi:hypothetical protein
MATRTESQINTIVKNCKANAFEKMMDYGAALEKGVAPTPSLTMQLNLIWGAENYYATLSQKNVFADNIGRLNLDATKPDGLGVNGLFSPTL